MPGRTLPPPFRPGRVMPTSGVGLIFPGQGTQFVGMGADLHRRYPEARDVFAEADEALGYSLSTLCFDGPDEELQQGKHTQPAIVAVSTAIWRVLAARLDVSPIAAAGHSLGEYSALVAAEALSLADALPLVAARARCMEAAAGEAAGMLALLGLDRDAADALCREAATATGGYAAIANHNCPGQLVVAGHARALDRVQELARDRGARRAVRLVVTVASHTPLLQPACDAFAPRVAAVPISNPRFPVIGNARIRPLVTAADVRAELPAQLVQPVDWPATVSALAESGAARLWELGPKSVLAGLNKRIDGAPPVVALTTAKEVDVLLSQVEVRA
ncbi:MAG: ACP S-malonyltransferase [Anaerolineae bacterium]|nr:ACP S-malonyltransferase [Anaerolineae bacterium]